MKKLLKTFVAILMVFTILPALTNVKAASGLKNPTIKDDVTTWDCIYFGNYYQSDSSTKEPIKWRVLSVSGSDAFIIADQNLDCQQYNTTKDEVTWETCTLRSWLNNDFLNTAFTSEEQEAILPTTVINDDNPNYQTKGGNNTSDKIYLLSIAEVSNEAYGFNSTADVSIDNRWSKNTAYTISKGALTYASTTSSKLEGNGSWWLRSPGENTNTAAYVSTHGYTYIYGNDVNYSSYAIRPVMHINLNSSCWSNAGTVQSRKYTQSITGTSSYKKVYGNAAFNLNAKADTPLTYASSNKNIVTVSTSGKVTIKGVGKATITITAKETDDYKSATKKVTITVNPKGTSISSLVKGTKSFTVKWNKRTTQTTGYQIQYSTSSKFTSAKTVTVSSYKTTSKTIKSLKAKKKYYVRVRTYKTVSGTKYYSSWSGYKTVTTK